MPSRRSFLLVLCVGLTSLTCALLFALSALNVPFIQASIEDASSYTQVSAAAPVDTDNGDINIGAITLFLWATAGILALACSYSRRHICLIDQAHCLGVGRATLASKREGTRGIAWARGEDHSLREAMASRRLAGFVCVRGCCS
jgi:hypothetical protein